MSEAVEFRQGYVAQQHGVPFDKNPYADKSLVRCQEWRKGYQQAEIDEADGQHFRDR